MRKLSLLFTMLALLFVAVGAEAAGTKTISLSFANDDADGIAWHANTCTVSGGTISFTNGNVNKPFWTFSSPVSVKDCAFDITSRTAETTFEFIDVNNNVTYYHSFGKDPVSVNDFSAQAKSGNADLNQIKQINLDPRTDNKDVSITFSSITLTIAASYDEVVNIPTTDNSLFPLTQEGVDTKIWGDTNSFDESTKTITLGNDGNAVGWTFAEAKNLSEYSKLVIEFQDAPDFGFQVRFRNATRKSTNQDVHYIGLEQGSLKYEIDLTASNFKYDGQEKADDASLDLTDINAIYFWAWAGKRELKLKSVYLVSATGITTYLVRNNTASNKFGTICLPFSASKPSNAAVYSVVGYDDNNVYLKDAEAIEAGKAYVFESTDANDITFTKTGTDENLAEAESVTGGLVGTFAEKEIPTDSYLLHDGKWYKTNGNKVGAYRAYLTFSDDLKVATAPANAKGMRLGDNTVTGINSVKGAETLDNNAPVYNLAGQRVDKNYKGVVIKNGRKYIVK